jgi:hypothetical protein
MSKRWTQEEISAWQDYFDGEGPMPKTRSLEYARQRFQAKPVFKLEDRHACHVASVAAMKYLPGIPFTQPLARADFVERAVKLAAKPWLMPRDADHMEILTAAVKAARQAVHAQGLGA